MIALDAAIQNIVCDIQHCIFGRRGIKYSQSLFCSVNERGCRIMGICQAAVFFQQTSQDFKIRFRKVLVPDYLYHQIPVAGLGLLQCVNHRQG